MEDLGVDGRKILNTCSRNKIRAWAALIWLRKGTNVELGLQLIEHSCNPNYTSNTTGINHLKIAQM